VTRAQIALGGIADAETEDSTDDLLALDLAALQVRYRSRRGAWWSAIPPQPSSLW